MNATVTRPATKSAAAKSVGKTATKSKSAAGSAKPGTEKAGATSQAKITVNASPAPKTRTAATKVIADSSKTAVKNSVQSAAEPADKTPVKGTTAAKATTTATRAAAVKTPKAGKGATELKQASVTPESIPSSKETSDASLSSNKESVGLSDTMEKPVVSKVSEVATKTTKSTPTVPADGTLLTEEQILKMSDKDYMNEAQLAFFKARLQQLERDLLKNAGETTEHLRETVLVPDPADRATIEEEHALELRTRDRERKLLKKVQQSIASIDAGEYGWCEETGEPIGIPRLLARPTATLSLEAQQRRELKQKLYGD